MLHIRASNFKTLLVSPSKLIFSSLFITTKKHVVTSRRKIISNVYEMLTTSSTSSTKKCAHKPVKIKTKDYHDKVTEKYYINKKDKAAKT